MKSKKSLIKRLWAYGNYSKFIRPGYRRIDVNGTGDETEELKPVLGDWTAKTSLSAGTASEARKE